jgi:hypothetical protein
VSIERLDASAECDGIVPASAPAPVTVRRTPPGGATCAGGISDGTGHVAVAARAAGGASWQVFAADGRPLRTFSAWPAAARPEGFGGIRVSPGPDEQRPMVEHVSIAPDGGLRAAFAASGDPEAETHFRWSFGGDPAGGSLVLSRSVTLGGNHWHLLRAHRFDAGGARAWGAGGARVEHGPDPTAPLFMAGAVSTRGEALAVYQHSAFLHASWLDRSGDVAASGTDELYLDAIGSQSAGPHDLELFPLLDGGLAFRAGGVFRRAYAHLATSSGALPSWLAARADWTYRLTRGSRGYAAFPPAGTPSPDCSQAIDLVSAGGRLCGRIVLREAGSGCTAGAVDQGWDGTVIQQSGRDACTYRWWPALLDGS